MTSTASCLHYCELYAAIFTTYVIADSFALLFTLFLHVEKCQNVSKFADLIESLLRENFFYIFVILLLKISIAQFLLLLS